MTDYELFETIVLLTCNKFNTQWQDVCKRYSKKSINHFNSKWFIYHLSCIYIGSDFTTEVLNIPRKSLWYCTKKSNEMPKELKELQQLINLYIKTNDNSTISKA